MGAFIRTLKALRRGLYRTRAIIPGLRRRHRLESLVGPLGYWGELQAYQLNAVKSVGLQPHHALLDIGCGPLQGGEMFIRYLQPGRYVGVEVHAAVFEVAREQVDARSLQDKLPELILSTTFGDDELGSRQFDFVWLSQILYYFPDATMDRLFTMLARRLSPDGVMAGDILPAGADRAFLKQKAGAPHTLESLSRSAAIHGLQVTARGVIRDLGYPRRLALSNNVLVEVRRRAGVPDVTAKM